MLVSSVVAFELWAAVGAFLASTAASRSTASVVGGRRALAHERGTTERFAWPYVDVVIEKPRPHDVGIGC